jgi:hypothetical protein
MHRAKVVEKLTGWKFVGNPEMEMWTGDTPSQRIY